PEKTLEVYQRWQQAYPRETVPWENAALTYSALGQHEKALQSANQALQLDPKDRYAYGNVLTAYLALGRYAEAKAVADQAKAQNLESINIDLPQADMAFIQGDWPTFVRITSSGEGSADGGLLTWWRGNGLSALGKVKEAHATYEQANAFAKQTGQSEF